MNYRIWVERTVGLDEGLDRNRKFAGTYNTFRDLTDEPMQTLTSRYVHMVLEPTNAPAPAPVPGKPPYHVPTMAEIRALPWNGFTVASTFSGMGGSSLGYRMAGFKVAWASEFVPEARTTYLANCDPATIVDDRDIRLVRADDILSALNLRPGELDLFDGSPPCSSYSSAGSREKGWGKAKKYSDIGEQRTDNLFAEYIRLVDGLRPKTFLAENVKGLTMGTAKGTFIEILKAIGYRVEARVVDASWLGVPQSRQRTIFVGVREDLGLAPVFPKPLPYRYTIRDVLPNLASVIHDASGLKNFCTGEVIDRPCPAITVGVDSLNSYHFKVVEAESDITGTAIGAEWDRMGRPGTQSEKYFQLVRPELDRPCPTITATAGTRGAAGVCHPTERRKFSIAEVKALSGVPHDFVLTGTFKQQWERLGRIHCPVAVRALAEAVRDNVLRKIKP